jgi:hypothetical protein
MIFNKKLLSLRDKKKTIIDEINSYIDRLDQIEYMTGQKAEKSYKKLNLRPEEQPEK